ncbi:Mor transcription activator family protein [Paracoccus sanguinis]|uniref:Mor transcription activator family protein n=1 Tax=Paracoccus sanguinis TaxID=1545044 RepID=A0A099GE87_9RHOB|nr:Mor transcription activator family protein [Paracoccus sanguinis]KGJ18707.1 hypothetical protein IX57_03000 [Paracoccus sanguinis]KGJ21039.1 hypothetical protein IX55_03715 [Paracoccus sanguinis]KGJ23262.1 hypothetical protein IX56_03100 [Paracoccus sanguinis]SDX43764.1 Mor transcription activator family protein [Paracoccus sanguinis]
MTTAGWIDELEADLGLPARLRLVANAGGQRRPIPHMASAGNSKLAGEVGADVARWLASRFAGEDIDIPNDTSTARSAKSARLVADILEAGLTEPTRSANDLARAHGVTRRWVVMLRAALRAERTAADDQLPLF